MSGLCLLIRIILISSTSIAKTHVNIPIGNQDSVLNVDLEQIKLMAMAFALGSVIQLLKWGGSLVIWALGKGQDRMKHIDDTLKTLNDTLTRVENKVEILERTSVSPEAIIGIVREELEYARGFRDE